MTSDSAAAERAAFIPDLGELAARFDVVLANPWIDRAGFLRDIVDALGHAALVLPGGQSRARLVALAEGIGVELADPRAELDGCLRDTRDALGAVAESTATDLRAAADRAAWVAGLRDLADFLAAHPDVPVPPAYHRQTIHVFPDGDSDAERRAEVDRVAATLGVPAAESGAGHYRAALSFGPAEYLAVALPPADQAEDSAAVTPDAAGVAA